MSSVDLHMYCQIQKDISSTVALSNKLELLKLIEKNVRQSRLIKDLLSKFMQTQVNLCRVWQI